MRHTEESIAKMSRAKRREWKVPSIRRRRTEAIRLAMKKWSAAYRASVAPQKQAAALAAAQAQLAKRQEALATAQAQLAALQELS